MHRLLAALCFVFAALFAALCCLVVVSKITVLDPVSVTAILLFGGAATTLTISGRVLRRRA